MSKNEIDLDMKLTVNDTLQRILNKIDDQLDLITDDSDEKNDSDCHGEPPKCIRHARVINELSQSYAFLAKYSETEKESQKNNIL